MSKPDAPESVVLDLFERALTKLFVDDEPCLPARPRGRACVGRRWRRLRPLAQARGIRVEVVDSFLFLDLLFEALDTQLGSPGNQGYLEKTQIPEPVLADFFAAAAECYRMRPWIALSDSDTLLLSCDEWAPRHRYAVIMGSGREIYGFALYHSYSDVETARTTHPETGPAVPSLALLYEKLSELGPTRTEEMKTHGWELATRNAYPLAVHFHPGEMSIWPSEEELRMLTGSARVLGPFAKKARAQVQSGEGPGRVEETSRVAVVGREVEVTATFPAPRA